MNRLEEGITENRLIAQSQSEIRDPEPESTGLGSENPQGIVRDSAINKLETFESRFEPELDSNTKFLKEHEQDPITVLEREETIETV